MHILPAIRKSARLGQTIAFRFMMQIFQGGYVLDLYDLYDLYDLARDAGWEPCNLHGLGHVSWVGSVLHRPCETFSHAAG